MRNVFDPNYFIEYCNVTLNVESLINETLCKSD